MERVLVIDDDITVLETLKAQLASFSYTAIGAASGKEGIELAKNGQPDLILLDINMPEMTGFDVLRKLKNEEMTRDIPVMMLTGSTNREDVIESMRFDVVDYIVKPHDAVRLKKKLEVFNTRFSNLALQRSWDDRNRVELKRTTGETVLVFRGHIEASIIRETNEIFTPTLQKRAREDNFIIDFRSLKELKKEMIAFLENLLFPYNPEKIFIIGGKHYGTVADAVKVFRLDNVFISEGDLRIYIES